MDVEILLASTVSTAVAVTLKCAVAEVCPVSGIVAHDAPIPNMRRYAKQIDGEYDIMLKISEHPWSVLAPQYAFSIVHFLGARYMTYHVHLLEQSNIRSV